jgi:hypothetical protein
LDLEVVSSIGQRELAEIIESTPASRNAIANRSKVQGFGLNDSPFTTSIKVEGKSIKHPAYSQWADILKRCYCKKFIVKFPTYVGCNISDEWLLFSNYLKWWKEHYVNDYEIDKDILFEGNKLYSKETCIFIPDWLNSFILKGDSKSRKYKIGVVRHKGRNRFQAQCNEFGKGNKYIGYFETEDEAHEAWLNRKLELLLSVKDKIDNMDSRLYNCIYNNILNSK